MDAEFFKHTLEGNIKSVVAIDPGETVGAVHFIGGSLQKHVQLKGMSVPEVFVKVRDFIREAKPDVVVMEDYRVYSWKTADHAWNDMFTSRLIGAIECHCWDEDIPLVKQMAQQAKGFCTDDKLRAWGFWHEGLRHARDATRHAVYYLLFTIAKVHQQEKPHA